MPGASTFTSRSLIAFCVSPTPRINEGMKAPRTPPITVPIGPATAVPAAAPPIPATRDGAIRGICSPAVCDIQSQRSPAVVISRKRCLTPPASACPNSASAAACAVASRPSAPTASAEASTKRQPRPCRRSTPLLKAPVKLSCLAAFSEAARFSVSSLASENSVSSLVNRFRVTGAVAKFCLIRAVSACLWYSGRVVSPIITGGTLASLARF